MLPHARLPCFQERCLEKKKNLIRKIPTGHYRENCTITYSLT